MKDDARPWVVFLLHRDKRGGGTTVHAQAPEEAIQQASAMLARPQWIKASKPYRPMSSARWPGEPVVWDTTIPPEALEDWTEHERKLAHESED